MSWVGRAFLILILIFWNGASIGGGLKKLAGLGAVGVSALRDRYELGEVRA